MSTIATGPFTPQATVAYAYCTRCKRRVELTLNVTVQPSDTTVSLSADESNDGHRFTHSVGRRGVAFIVDSVHCPFK